MDLSTKFKKIAIGTSSQQKIRYVKEVLQTIGIQAKLYPNDVHSLVSYQPLSSTETKQGSINRSKEALMNSTIPVDFSLGVEIGYQLNEEEKYEILCWSSIYVINKKGEEKIFSSQSSSFLLPDYHQHILKQGLPLGEYVDYFVKLSDDVTTRYVAVMIRDREPFIVEATRNVILQYFANNE